MAREKFQIDGKRLKELREESGKTQLTVAKELHAKLGIKTSPPDATLITSYQRNERTGNISRQRAKALSEIFKVPLKVLQGDKPFNPEQKDDGVPDPRDYLQQIEQTIREVLAKAENSTLQQALQQTFAETRFTSGSDEENREDAIRYLAEDIARRIEAVQLVRNKNEIADLVQLTGITEAELLRPVNVDGHWFINVFESWKTDPNAPPDELNIRSEVTQGAGLAIYSIKEAIQKSSKNLPECSDESITLSHDGFWYKVEAKLSLRKTIRIDLVRCQPDAKGLRWVKPSWRDEYLIREPLIDWAKANFNFICDFDGKQSPSGDIRQLRFLVTEYNQSSPGIRYKTGRMVISGNLEEISDELLASLREQGRTHFKAQRLLTNDLRDSLAPFLSDYPPECWSMSGPSIRLDESKAKDRKRPFFECFWGEKYEIELVEQVGEQFEPVPWREKDKRSLEKILNEMLNDPAWATNEPRRAFTPYSAEP
ncbi:MAG: hypothetical protein CVU33_02700 [Betaproteobacteria bacterium HGW-Betaproteobacteria-6]|jgi:transcriptional regulator with XRE-family HTH domain|nr:MAG: hypothetical protein CVU33_02700 [Betaproteobacteria bacterium HGW-Betaproteobacteria-6]